MLESWSTLSGFILLLCISSVCSDGYSGRQPPSSGDSKVSIRQISGLYPFPRVGRSGGESLEEDDWDYVEPMVDGFYKRQSLIPFPRIGKRHRGLVVFPRVGKSVDDFATESRHISRPILSTLLPSEELAFDEVLMGRGDVPLTIPKRSPGQGGNVGVWFGPRLGRRKRSTLEEETDLNLHPLDSYREREQTTWSNPEGEALRER